MFHQVETSLTSVKYSTQNQLTLLPINLLCLPFSMRYIELMKRIASYLFLAVLLTGCASGSALITGEVRPAIENHNTIRILTKLPVGAEEIAILKAESGMGFTQQGDLNYALDELKKQAAKIGANAVVITGRSTSTSVGSYTTYDGDTRVGSSQAEVVEGIAIWVD